MKDPQEMSYSELLLDKERVESKIAKLTDLYYTHNGGLDREKADRVWNEKEELKRRLTLISQLIKVKMAA